MERFTRLDLFFSSVVAAVLGMIAIGLFDGLRAVFFFSAILLFIASVILGVTALLSKDTAD